LDETFIYLKNTIDEEMNSFININIVKYDGMINGYIDDIIKIMVDDNFNIGKSKNIIISQI
jgi:hypothetical protein